MENERKRLMEEEWNSRIPTGHQLSRAHFPPDFLFGVATSAYQVFFSHYFFSCGYVHISNS
ncbi:putative glycoside hydrolase superfamily [Helianthus annuus]|nr:putative glycoside hydrolase superfamily [Helianthus annuus]